MSEPNQQRRRLAALKAWETRRQRQELDKALVQKLHRTPAFFLGRHASGDWGEVDAEDWKANDDALKDGTRHISAYRTLKGVRLWVITEWDRSVTTVLLPDEY